MKYQTLLNDEEIRKRRIWQDQIYKKLKSIDTRQEVEVLGRQFVVLLNMFAPLWVDSVLLAKNVIKEVKNGDIVLDLGTGTGVQGIFAADKAKKVVSVDINEVALDCAKVNIERNKLFNKVEVIESDLFSNVNDKFDLIIFNPPFRWFKPRDMLERGEVDENYKTLQKFFAEVRKYLNSNGRILMVFSESGDIEFFKKLIDKNRFNYNIVDETTSNGWKYFVYKIW